MRPIVRHSVLLALLAASALPALAAEDFGTLFTTPEERARLDRLRRGEPVAAAASPDGFANSRKPAITGYVQRSDGRNTVWIDGRPVVVASPGGGTLLEPEIVQPGPGDPGVRIEESGKAKR